MVFLFFLTYFSFHLSPSLSLSLSLPPSLPPPTVQDATVRVWDVLLCRVVLVLSGHTHSVTCIKWGGEGLIYTGSQDRTIKVWRAKDVSYWLTMANYNYSGAPHRGHLFNKGIIISKIVSSLWSQGMCILPLKEKRWDMLLVDVCFWTRLLTCTNVRHHTNGVLGEKGPVLILLLG